jgi:hypothetical protein
MLGLGTYFSIISKMESFACSECGVVGFKNTRALANHQRTKHERKSESQSKRTRPWEELTHHWEASSSHQMPNVPKLLEDSLANIDSFESLEFIGANDPNLAQFQSFDSTFSLVHWIKTCTYEGGLSTKDMASLFKQVLIHPSFNIGDVFVKSVVDVENYGNQVLYNEAHGWKEHEIQGHILHYRDPILILQSLFSSPKVAEGFTLRPTYKVNENNERVYSTPISGDWWHNMQVISNLFVLFIIN